MTASTRAHAHAFLVTCPTRHMPAVPRLNFRLPNRKPDIRITPTIVPQHAKEAMTSRDGTSTLTGSLAGWGAVARSPHGRIDVMFGPVITTEAHLAFAGARIHSNNTAEMLAMIEASGSLAWLPVDTNSCIFTTPNTLLAFAWARIKPARMYSWHLRANSRCWKSSTGYGLPCNTCGHTGNLGK